MAKRKFFLIIDTETTQDDKVADFGAVVCDKQGNVHHEAGVLLKEFYFDRVNHPLFHMGDFLGGQRNLPRRYAAYDAMIDDGRRMAASVAAVNRWLAQVATKYNPVLTAYNLGFDRAKLEGSGIMVNALFPQQFCLWHAAAQKWGRSKAYRQFVLDNHFFGARTERGHMGYQTKADIMAKFLLGSDYPDEPHTALEDAKDYELPILRELVKNTSPKVYMNPTPYNWRDYALNKNFSAT